MGLYLGIDGGGSGCRAAVADASGRVLGRGEAASANIWSDPETALVNIVGRRRGRRRRRGVARASATSPRCSASPAPTFAEAATRLAERLPFARARIETDALIALKGALGDEDGITATLGTGSVFGVQRGGAVRMIGGWGFLLGDQGSGARIGRALLERALLAADGLADPTPLLDRVLEQQGGPAGVVAFGRRAVPADFAEEVPAILDALSGGRSRRPRRSSPRRKPRSRSRSTGCRRTGRCRCASSAGSGRTFAARLAPRYPGLIRPPLGTALDGALAMARSMGCA